ncbi:MAG TPA: alpha/beta family hydrolase [Ilumatobacteraceae bacterium]
MAATVLLYPGAGSDSSHPSLRAIERAVAPAKCVRADFPYRREGRRAPDRAPKLMAAIRDEIASLGKGALVMGGRSMGGRICSMVAAGVDREPPPPKLAGLVLISYPLHPPGKPDQLRVEHLPDVRVPCLFVSGTRDPFGSPDELTAWTATISAPVTHVWIEGGRHDLKGADGTIADAVATFVKSVVAPAPRRPRMR